MRYFAGLAEELSFTRAARRLHIAQPALSQQIKALERQLGVRLVERDSKGCALTAVGAVVAAEAHRVLEQVAAADARIAAAVQGRQGRLRIAYTRSARGGVADALILAFRDRHPEVEVGLQTGWTAHNVAELLAGRLDAAFVRPPLDVPELACHVLAEEELLLAVPADHPLAATRTRVSRRRIRDEPVVLWPRENGPGMHDRITGQLWPGHRPRIVREEPDDEQLLMAVAAGYGIAPIPEGRARTFRIPGVRLRRLTAPTPTVALGLAHNPDTASPAVRLLLAVAGPDGVG
ncbi:LysR family transcriptional regulator [Streptantibioticus cattleyicolor]|uniref:LysR family transcriptional regulator n=1 Tax=Streptantibioticus cattleyicolor (strain ATCC 35852 / DSM 46488 / JCM 4925 / NBRC 14057 / NRRL 8057) TaxID=1003195 RepID=F8JKX8_STREN|nr:LysR family transcriptional regulator [Streptantibioticus cattleyicolor NRRL 8057 = DSM 46488]CCB71296.1 LysR family transcriptional regulator [Streptantibioticus cattleyicolor NRRL 8057 = DSM 46488]